MMSDKNTKDKSFLIKYCKIMISKLDDTEDEIRMNKWLETVTNSKCNEITSLMYIKLLLWALHTDRIDVFPFKYVPPIDHGGFSDAFKYAQEIVQFEPEDEKAPSCSEVRTVVSDDLKEYFAIQSVSGFGTHCFYAFTDGATLPNWNMPSNMNFSKQNHLENESDYWSKIFSRPKYNKINISSHEENETNEEEMVVALNKLKDDVQTEQKSENEFMSADLCKVEKILQNLSFGGANLSKSDSLTEEKSACKTINDNSNKTQNKSKSGISVDSFDACVSKTFTDDSCPFQKQNKVVRGENHYCVQTLTEITPILNHLNLSDDSLINRRLKMHRSSDDNNCYRSIFNETQHIHDFDYDRIAEVKNVKKPKDKCKVAKRLLKKDYALSSYNLFDKQSISKLEDKCSIKYDDNNLNHEQFRVLSKFNDIPSLYKANNYKQSLESSSSSQTEPCYSVRDHIKSLTVQEKIAGSQIIKSTEDKNKTIFPEQLPHWSGNKIKHHNFKQNMFTNNASEVTEKSLDSFYESIRDSLIELNVEMFHSPGSSKPNDVMKLSFYSGRFFQLAAGLVRVLQCFNLVVTAENLM